MSFQIQILLFKRHFLESSVVGFFFISLKISDYITNSLNQLSITTLFSQLDNAEFMKRITLLLLV